ncbi:polyprotein [Brown algae endornavirus 1]|nr:polyprotein [Brown algae endornavirus 1]
MSHTVAHRHKNTTQGSLRDPKGTKKIRYKQGLSNDTTLLIGKQQSLQLSKYGDKLFKDDIIAQPKGKVQKKLTSLREVFKINKKHGLYGRSNLDSNTVMCPTAISLKSFETMNYSEQDWSEGFTVTQLVAWQFMIDSNKSPWAVTDQERDRFMQEMCLATGNLKLVASAKAAEQMRIRRTQPKLLPAFDIDYLCIDPQMDEETYMPVENVNCPNAALIVKQAFKLIDYNVLRSLYIEWDSCASKFTEVNKFNINGVTSYHCCEDEAIFYQCKNCNVVNRAIDKSCTSAKYNPGLCGVCFHHLEFDCDATVIINDVVKSLQQVATWSVGASSKLHDLTLAGYLDGSQLPNKSLEEHMARHDERLFNQVRTKWWFEIAEIPAHTSNDCKKHLGRRFPSILLKQVNKGSAYNADDAAEFFVLSKIMRGLKSSNTKAIVEKTIDRNWLVENLDKLNKRENLLLLVHKKMLNLGEGVKTYECDAVYPGPEHAEVMRLNLDVIRALNCQYVTLNKTTYRIQTVTESEHWNLISISIHNGTRNKYVIKKTDNLVKTARIPYVAVKLLDMLPISPIHSEEFTIEHNLLRKLMVRNMTGLMDMTELINYGRALAQTRITSGNFVSQPYKYTPKQIIEHSYIASTIMKRLHSQRYHLTNDELLNHLVASGMQIASNLIDNKLPKFNEVREVLTRLGSKFRLSIMKDVYQNPVWDDLSNWAYEVGLENAKIYDLGKPSKLSQPASCNHHTTNCEHAQVSDMYCRCCKTHAPEKHSYYCHCCMPDQCSHNDSCNHKCEGQFEHVGDKICKCCGKPAPVELCSMCNDKSTFNEEMSFVPDVEFTVKHKVKKTVFKKFTTNTSKKQQPKPIKTRVQFTKSEDPVNSEDKKPVSLVENAVETTVDEPWSLVGPSVDDQSLKHILNSDESTFIANIQSLLDEDEIVACNRWDGEWENAINEIPLASGISHLVRMKPGMSQLNQGKWESINEKEAEVTNTGDICGYCCMKTMNKDVSLKQLQSVANCSGNFSALDMLKLCEINNWNMAIDVGHSLLVGCYNPGHDKFMTIKHINENHWVLCQILQLGYSTVGPHFDELDDNELSKLSKSVLDLRSDTMEGVSTVAKALGIARWYLKLSTSPLYKSLGKLEVVRQQDKCFLTNNNEHKHDQYTGLINLEVPMSDWPTLSLLNDLQNPDNLKEAVLSAYHDVPSKPTNNLKPLRTTELSSAVRDLLQYIINLDSDNGEKLIYKKQMLRAHPRTNTVKISSVNDKTKPNDIIVIKYAGKTYLRFLFKSGGHWVIMPGEFANRKVSIAQTKLSVGSMLLRITSVINMQLSDVEGLIESAIVYYGDPGTGKSTKLIAIANEARSYTAVTLTRPARDRLVSAGLNSNNVMTLEKASITKINTEILLIDEATQVTWFDIAKLITTKVVQLYMFGDTAQITKKDFSTTPGTRTIEPAINLTNNKHKLTINHRFGGDLYEELKPLLNSTPSDKAPHTEVIKYSSEEFDRSKFTTILENDLPDVIITFTQRTASILRSELSTLMEPNDQPEVVTAHSYQANDANNVLVIQWESSGNSLTGVTNMPEYNFSAATRAKMKLIWWSISGHTQDVSLAARINDDFRGSGLHQLLPDLMLALTDFSQKMHLPEIGTEVLNLMPERLEKLQNLCETDKPDLTTHDENILRFDVMANEDKFSDSESDGDDDPVAQPVMIQKLNVQVAKQHAQKLVNKYGATLKFSESESQIDVQIIDTKFNSGLVMHARCGKNYPFTVELVHIAMIVPLSRGKIKRMFTDIIAMSLQDELIRPGDPEFNDFKDGSHVRIIPKQEPLCEYDVMLPWAVGIKFRALAHLRFLLPENQTLEVRIDNQLFVVEKTMGCSQYCGLKFYKDKVLKFIIGGSHKANLRRNVKLFDWDSTHPSNELLNNSNSFDCELNYNLYDVKLDFCLALERILAFANAGKSMLLNKLVGNTKQPWSIMTTSNKNINDRLEKAVGTKHMPGEINNYIGNCIMEYSGKLLRLQDPHDQRSTNISHLNQLLQKSQYHEKQRPWFNIIQEILGLNKIGALTIKGLYLSEERHKELRTPGYHLLMDKLSNALKQIYDTDDTPLWLSVEQINTYGQTLREEFPNMPLCPHAYMENSSAERLIESVIYFRGKQNGFSQFALSHFSIPMMNSDLDSTAVTILAAPGNEINNHLNLAKETIKVLEGKIQQRTESKLESDQLQLKLSKLQNYTSGNKTSLLTDYPYEKPIVLGLKCMHNSLEDFHKLLAKTRQLELWLPNITNVTGPYNHSVKDGLDIIYYDNSEDPIQMSKLCNTITTETQLIHTTSDGKYIFFKPTDNIMGHNVYTVEYTVKPQLYCSVNATVPTNSIKLTLPIVSNVSELTRTGKLIRIKTFNFNKNFYEKLMYKMLQKDITFKELIYYARGLTHSYMYSATGYKPQYNVNPVSVVDACCVAYIKANYLIQPFKSYDSTDYLAMLKNATQKLHSWLSTDGTDMLNDNLTTLAIDNDKLATIIDSWVKTSTNEVKPHNRTVYLAKLDGTNANLVDMHKVGSWSWVAKEFSRQRKLINPVLKKKLLGFAKTQFDHKVNQLLSVKRILIPGKPEPVKTTTIEPSSTKLQINDTGFLVTHCGMGKTTLANMSNAIDADQILESGKTNDPAYLAAYWQRLYELSNSNLVMINSLGLFETIKLYNKTKLRCIAILPRYEVQKDLESQKQYERIDYLNTHYNSLSSTKQFFTNVTSERLIANGNLNIKSHPKLKSKLLKYMIEVVCDMNPQQSQVPSCTHNMLELNNKNHIVKMQYKPTTDDEHNKSIISIMANELSIDDTLNCTLWNLMNKMYGCKNFKSNTLVLGRKGLVLASDNLQELNVLRAYIMTSLAHAFDETEFNDNDKVIPGVNDESPEESNSSDGESHTSNDEIIEAVTNLSDKVKSTTYGAVRQHFPSDHTLILRKKRILFVAFGSRGDLDPVILLASAMQQVGAHITIVSHSIYKSELESLHFEVIEIPTDPRQSLRILSLAFDGDLHLLKDILKEHIGSLGAAIPTLESMAFDLILDCPFAMLGCAAGYAHNTPVMFLCPFLFELWDTPEGIRLHSMLNKLGMVSNICKLMEAHDKNFVYEELADFIESNNNIMYMCSEYLVDPNRLPAGHLITGPCYNNRPNASIPIIESMFKENKKIIAICWGSLTPTNTDKIADVIKVVVSMWDLVVVTGDTTATDAWDNNNIIEQHLSGQSVIDNLLIIGSIGYDYLFPRCDTVLCHGGAGTIHRALAHKVKLLITPFMGDQFYWANMVEELGLGCCSMDLNSTNIKAACQRLKQIDMTNFSDDLVESCKGDVNNNLNSIVNFFNNKRNSTLTYEGPLGFCKIESTIPLPRLYSLGHWIWSGDHQEIYNPDVAGFCFKECFEDWLKHGSVRVNDYQSLSQVIKLEKYVEVTDIIGLSMLCKFNLILINDVTQQKHMFITNPLGPTIGLKIMRQGLLSHCVRVNFNTKNADQIIDVPRRAPTSIPETIRFSDHNVNSNITMSINELKDTVINVSKLQAIPAESDLAKVLAKPINILNAEFKFKNLYHTMNRQAKPVTFYNTFSTRYGYVISKVVPHLINRFVIVSDVEARRVMLCIKLENCTVLLGDQPNAHCDYIAVTTTMLKLPELKVKLEKKPLDTNNSIINITSRNYLEKNEKVSNWPVGSTTAKLLHISHFDNRTHHEVEGRVQDKQVFDHYVKQTLLNPDVSTIKYYGRVTGIESKALVLPLKSMRIDFWVGLRMVVETDNPRIRDYLLNEGVWNDLGLQFKIKHNYVVNTKNNTLNNMRIADSRLSRMCELTGNVTKMRQPPLALGTHNIDKQRFTELFRAQEIAAEKFWTSNGCSAFGEEELMVTTFEGTNTTLKAMNHTGAICINCKLHSVTGLITVSLVDKKGGVGKHELMNKTDGIPDDKDVDHDHTGQSTGIWSQTSDVNPTKFTKWWNLPESKVNNMPADNLWGLKSADVLTDTGLESILTNEVLTGDDNEFKQELLVNIEPNKTQTTKFSNTDFDEPDVFSVNLYEDTDLTDHTAKYLPENNVRIKCRETGFKTKLIEKSIKTNYPVYSRPVLTKLNNAEFNAVTGRLASVKTVRKVNLNVGEEVNRFANIYFDEDKRNLLNSYKTDPVGFDYTAIKAWLTSRPDAVKIAAEVDAIMVEGFETNQLNTIKVHLKLESLLKENPVKYMKQLQPRIIAWQSKGICALYSHCFKNIKQRFKSMLKQNVIYTDGMTPDNLGERCRNVQIKPTYNFVENDLTKQDRQTDHNLIDFEMAIYIKLGADKNLIESWLRVHKNWRARGTYIVMHGDAMRLTGQATTALGNAIVNLICHMDLVERLSTRLILMLILGDDNAFLVDGEIDTVTLRRWIADKCNMFSKAKSFKNVCQFCSMLLYKTTDERLELGPNLVRMKRRFEVTNGVHKLTDNNAEMRAMSYAMMLGKDQQLDELVKEYEWPITTTTWYDQLSNLQANAEYNEISQEQVLSYKQNLIAYLKEFNTYKSVYWTVDTEKR